MAHPIRRVEEMPMVVDGGASGLKQSRHHPNAGLGAQNPMHADVQASAAGSEDKGSDREINEIQMKIIGIVQSEMAEEVKGIIERLVQLVGYKTARRDWRPSSKQLTTIGKLYKALITRFETLTSKIEKPQTQPRL